MDPVRSPKLMRATPEVADREKALMPYAGRAAITERSDDRRSFLAGLLIWVFAGSPITAMFVSIQVWLVVGLVLQLAICGSRKLHLNRAIPLALVGALYGIWTAMAVAIGMEGQGSGLLGSLFRISIVLIPMVTLKRLQRGLVESMAAICWVALLIFAIRQAILVVGLDIANLFEPFYGLTGLTQDRTILIFNFDIPEEVRRNCGPFREPGMFAANLVIAILVLLGPRITLHQSAVRRRVMLFGLTLLTTQSTMGLLTIPLLAGLSLRLFVSNKAARLLVVPIAVVIAAGSIAVLGTQHLDKIEEQLTIAQSEGTNSWYNTRFGNAYIDYLAIRQNPITGYGYSEAGRPIPFRVLVAGRLSVYEEGTDLGLGNGLTGTAVKFGLIFAVLLYSLFLWRLVSLYGSFSSGLVSWMAVGLILFGQQLLTLPTLYVLLGRFDGPMGRTPRRLPRAQNESGSLASIT